ncbi:MAG: DUF1904 family protein [Pseudobdellovibrio sp.]
MPHIRFRGMKESTAAKISEQAQQLAQIVNADITSFTFEMIQTKFFELGKETQAYPFVEVLWFSRAQEVKQAVASYLTTIISSLEQHEYITVIFTDLKADSYFENGKHF